DMWTKSAGVILPHPHGGSHCIIEGVHRSEITGEHDHNFVTNVLVDDSRKVPKRLCRDPGEEAIDEGKGCGRVEVPRAKREHRDVGEQNGRVKLPALQRELGESLARSMRRWRCSI